MKILNENNSSEWSKILVQEKFSLPQDSLKWASIIKKSYPNCEPTYFFKEEKDFSKEGMPSILVKSKIFGNRIISQPFIDMGNFLGTPDERFISEVLSEINKKFPEIKHLEIRLNTFQENYQKMEEILKKKGFRKEPKKFQFILELLPEEKMFGNFNRITRKGIKKAQKSNLTIKEIDREEELEKFYQLYLKNMKSFGTPQHSYNYFKNFMTVGKDFFKGLNCYREEKLIGSLIVFYNKTYMYAAYNFSDYKSLIYQPNDLLYWEMIRWASNHNISYFDFGQCEPDAEDGSHASGIYKFKSKWGGKLYKKSYFYYSFENEEKKSNKKSEYKKMIRVWRRLPLWIIKFIGPKIASQLAL